MNYNKHVQLHGKPGSGLFLQPRDQKILQDVADKPDVLPQTKFSRNKSKPTGTQRDHCVGRKLTPSPIMVPMAKQLLNISRQVAVLRTMTLHFWMLTLDMPWIVPMKLAHDAFVKKQELALDTDRWKLNAIQCEIWEAMVVTMKNAMQEVPADHEFDAQAQQLHLEFEKHLQYFTTQ